ncbi:MAG: group II intron reverse transcriptase/maturase [Bacteroidales bacterium]|nr:group II intron reverse transcriptase/maturase [Bacteroidales bacterium]
MTELKNTSNQENVQREIDRLSQKKRKERSSQEKVRLLQLKLYQKAKQESGYRFYILYDKIRVPYILEEAYKRCKKNGGSPGVDKQTFADVEEYGVKKFLTEIRQELRTRKYRPRAVRKKMIEKANGGQRPLGIPTIKDRVVQQACKMVIEPIFEADFDNLSYGFRPKRSAKGAITEIRDNLKAGKYEVYDADLSKYFDTIPHDKLEIALKERIADPRVLYLIKLWLKSPIAEEDGTYTGGKRNKKGTPQGGVISPLLANIYMNILDRIVNKKDGYFSKSGIEMIRYADDFILMSRHIKQELINKLHTYLRRMELTINTEKSKKINAKETSFDFLGFTFRNDRSFFNKNKRYIRIEPKAKSQKKIRQKINEVLKRIGHYRPEEVVEELNPIIRGWMNYYKIDKVSHTQLAFRKLDGYLRERLYRYYDRKSQRKTNFYGQKAFRLLVSEYGLIEPYKSSGLRPAYVCDEINRKAVCGKTARTV